MAKEETGNLKTLLVAFSTEREVEGETKRVRFAAGSVVKLTDKELADLTALQNATGKLHFRDPKSEGGKVAESEAEVVELPDYAGQDVAIADKTVDQLKAYLDFNSVSYEPRASKADLVELATKHEAGGDTDNDQDGGL